MRLGAPALVVGALRAHGAVLAIRALEAVRFLVKANRDFVSPLLRAGLVGAAEELVARGRASDDAELGGRVARTLGIVSYEAASRAGAAPGMERIARVLVAVCGAHVRVPETAAAAVEALGSCAELPEFERLVAEKCGGYGAVVAVLEAHPDSAQVACHACCALQ